jgi:hypothetical protein
MFSMNESNDEKKSSIRTAVLTRTTRKYKPISEMRNALKLNQLLFEGLKYRDPGGGAPPPKIGKNMIFWRKTVIFHTKYPNNFRASLRHWKKI